MNPLIQQAAANAPEAESFTWFYISNECLQSIASPIVHSGVLKLPFSRTAIVSDDASGGTTITTLCIADDDGSITVYVLGSLYSPTVMLTLAEVDGAVTRRVDASNFADIQKWGARTGKSKSAIEEWVTMTADHACSVIAITSNPVSSVEAHTATPQANNAKRARQGKKPMFTWTTVVIEPKAVAKAKPKGGTHASPRLHDRRGHWRNYKSGKQVWINTCKVGHAKDGIGFHDYEVRS